MKFCILFICHAIPEQICSLSEQLSHSAATFGYFWTDFLVVLDMDWCSYWLHGLVWAVYVLPKLYTWILHALLPLLWIPTWTKIVWRADCTEIGFRVREQQDLQSRLLLLSILIGELQQYMSTEATFWILQLVLFPLSRIQMDSNWMEVNGVWRHNSGSPTSLDECSGS